MRLLHNKILISGSSDTSSCKARFSFNKESSLVSPWL